MKLFLRLLSLLVGVDLMLAGAVVGWRLCSTNSSPPFIDTYTDALTAAELRNLPDRFLFDSVDKWHTLGVAYLKTGFLHQAEACLRRATEGDPRSAEIALLHGYCLDRLGVLDDAENVLRHAEQQGFGPVRATAAYFLGRIHLQRERAEEAAAAFRRAGDDHIPSVYQRAKLLVRSGQLQDAEPLLRRLVVQVPGEVRVWQLQVQLAEAQGKTEIAAQAADVAERARPMLWVHNLPPDLIRAGEEIGMAREFSRAQQHQKANNHIVAAHEMQALTEEETRWRYSNPWLLQTVADSLLQARQFAAARILLERQTIDEEFPTAKAWGLLAKVEFLEHDPEQALRAWQRAQSMNPALVDYKNMSRVAEEANDAEASRSYRALGQLYSGIDAWRRGDLHQAREELTNAASLDPGLPHAWFYLGEAERQLDNRRAAEVAYRQCLALKSEHGRARARLELWGQRVD